MFKINKVVKNLLSVGLSSILSQFLTFFMIAYYARILSIEGFGEINFAQSIIVYFTMITLFGFQTLGTREVSKKNKNIEKLVGNIITLRFLIAIICFLIILIVSFTINKGVVFKNILIIYGATLFPMVFNMDWFFSGIEKMEHNGIFNVLKNGVPFILICLFFRGENDIYLIPLFTLMGLLFASLYHIFIYRYKMKLKFSFGINKIDGKKYIKLSIPFLISGLLSMINCNIDSIIIGFTKGEYALGIYSSAYKIIFFITNLIAVIFTPFFPLLISYYSENNKLYLKKTVDNLCKIVILIGFPMCAGGILLSKEIIVLLFGDKYIEGYIPFIILLIYILVLFMRENYGYSLNAWNLEKKYLNSVTISALINFILNLIFIPRYGIIAAAITTLISEIINFIIMRNYSIKIVKTNYIEYIIKIIFPTLLMAICIITLKYFNVNILINILSAIIIYFVFVIKFKYITLCELREFLNKRE